LDLNIVGLIINLPEFIWTIINFFLLLFLLKKILYDPVLKHMDERDARIKAGLQKGTDAEKALEESKKNLAGELQLSSKEAREKVSEARGEAEKARSEALARAHGEAAAIQTDVREKIVCEEERARDEISGSMPELVMLLSNKLLRSDTVCADTALVESCIGANKE